MHLFLQSLTPQTCSRRGHWLLSVSIDFPGLGPLPQKSVAWAHSHRGPRPVKTSGSSLLPQRLWTRAWTCRGLRFSPTPSVVNPFTCSSGVCSPSGLRWERLWFRPVSVDVPRRVALLQKSCRVLWLRPSPLEVLDWTYDYIHRGLRFQPNFSAAALLYLLGASALTLLIIS